MYNLENDPFERNNLVKDSSFADIRKELAVKLIARMKEAGEKMPVILSKQ